MTKTPVKAGPPMRERVGTAVLTPSVEGPYDYWDQRIALFRKENASVQPGGIVFIGDSITERFNLQEAFPGYPVINRGIGGERIDHIAERIVQTVDRTKPRQIFLMSGINDTLFPNLPVETRAKNYEAVVQRIRAAAPEAEIVLQTVLPVTGKWSEKNPEVVQLNQQIRRIASDHGLTLLDTYPHFAGENGELRAEYSQDSVHLTKEAYAKWAELVRPLLKKPAPAAPVAEAVRAE